MSRFTAQQVCQIVSNEDPDDPEYLFDGSDDDLGMSDDEDLHLDDDIRSDIDCDDVEVENSTHDSLSPSQAPSTSYSQSHFQSQSHSLSAIVVGSRLDILPGRKGTRARGLLLKIRGFYTKFRAYYRTVPPQTVYFRCDRKQS